MRIVILSLLIILFGCTDKNHDETTQFTATLINNSTHSVKIQPYVSGSINLDKVINLQPSGTLEIASGFDWGKVPLGSGFDSKYFIGADSIIVIYDDTYRITHYLNTPGSLSPKHYLFSSLRNLCNKDSYIAKIEWEKEYSALHSYTFIFSDQDYLDAK